MAAEEQRLRETEPYRAAPQSMAAGLDGKCGRLKMRFERDSRGRSVLRHLERRAPMIVQQELYFDEAMPEMPCVYILSSGGPYVDGDRYEQVIELGRAAFAHVSTGAATKVASMRHNHAAISQRFLLEDDAYLEYIPEPVIPCRHARFVSDTTLSVAASATLLHAEIYSSGRRYHGEHFAYDMLSVAMRGERPSGERLFSEKMLIRPALESPATVGVMGDCEIFATALLLTTEHHAAAIYEAVPSGMFRAEGFMAGISPLPNRCGVIYRVAGYETEVVKGVVRAFADRVRREVMQRPLPKEFVWR